MHTLIENSRDKYTPIKICLSRTNYSFINNNGFDFLSNHFHVFLKYLLRVNKNIPPYIEKKFPHKTEFYIRTKTRLKYGRSLTDRGHLLVNATISGYIDALINAELIAGINNNKSILSTVNNLRSLYHLDDDVFTDDMLMKRWQRLKKKRNIPGIYNKSDVN